MIRRAHQVLAGYADGDAISREAEALRKVFRAWGWESDLFVDVAHVSPGLRADCRPLADLDAGPDDLVLHHYSIGCPAVEAFRRSPARKILLYHNITPAEYFRGFDDGVARRLETAREELAALLPAMAACWAVSEFNAQELRALGAGAVSVFPLLFDPAAYDLPPHPEVLKRLAVPMRTILFVGRMAPNKRVEDLIHAFAWYHRAMNRESRLIIVGSERSAPRYYLMLRMLAAELDLENVCFERFASPDGLVGYYDRADLFVTTSEHEGYCLPLLEAMHKGVPVLARRAGGMPEALGGAGVLYEDATPQELAALMDRLLEDVVLRARVLAGQARRMQAVRARDVAGELRALLAGLV